MRGALITLAALALLGLVGAGSVVGFGLYNVSAQAGHWPGVGWLLHTTFRNAVRLRAPRASAVPDLSDPALIALGAGHYATACAPCHAAPDAPLSATMRAMLPAPPPIREAIVGWQPNHLHWIVENGIKMSGMPGWPAEHRGDEIWAVVAYLEALRRAEAPALPAGGDDALAYCQTCHGAIPRHVPLLGLQNAEYLAGQLGDYLSGARPSGIMQQAVRRVPPEALPQLAQQFAAAPVPESATGAPPPEGRALATRGTRDVPACTACHGPGLRERRTDTPALAGQDAGFLEAQLRLWRDGIRQGSDRMEAAARDLSDAQIALLARYFAALPPQEAGQ